MAGWTPKLEKGPDEVKKTPAWMKDRNGSGNGHDKQKTLPGLPKPAAVGSESQNKQQPQMTARERYEANKSAQRAAGLGPVVNTHGSNNTIKRCAELLASGGFTRRLGWRERWALRRVERRVDKVRLALYAAFEGDIPVGVAHAMDSLAALEAVARLEMLCAKK